MSTRILEARRSLEQYREFEPLPDPNREQEIAEDVDEGKSNLFFFFCEHVTAGALPLH